MEQSLYPGTADSETIAELHKQFLTHPETLEDGWRRFFEGYEFFKNNYGNQPFQAKAIPPTILKEFQVINLINGYRNRGHLFTKTNPVHERRTYSPNLDLVNFGLSDADLETEFQAGNDIGIGSATLKDIVAHLQKTYCQSIGAEFKYIRQPDVVDWLQTRMEREQNTPQLTIDEKKTILSKLNEAVVFENFLQVKFVGQKRFALSGAETLIPALNTVIEHGAELGIEEFVIGMAHRGRLNVLANILKKTYEDIFSEFDGNEYEDTLFDGDVKYHLGYSGNITTEKGKSIHISVTPNPSHLEAVDPVVLGIVRAKIDMVYKSDESKIAPILIHGDAAIAGQGVVYETIQMSQLKGYKTGGTIHIVINNQVGFTTNYIDGRSSTYCTDIAKVILSPVFHVNGDDAEALVYTIRLAMDFRQKFNRDIFIDLLCYRRFGHNEADEPRFTQPLLYKTIEKHPDPRVIYNDKLTAQGEVEANLVKEMESSFKALLQEHLDEAKEITKAYVPSFEEGAWKDIRKAVDEDFDESPQTKIDLDNLINIGNKLTELPQGKKFNNKIEKLFNDRRGMLNNPGKIGWSMAELLAFGSLVKEGYPVRFSGQDVERGTFSQRHAVVTVEDSEEKYIPLNNIAPNQARFQIYNSLLSEYGVLGFDYGYALVSPNSLTIWEAQFGDFNNGAQIIIDQYISSGEDKWKRMNGIVLLLPHGYDGQGSEHSSARLERWLDLCATNNLQITNCTTPANYFHLLRRQLHRNIRKPLIVFTPKNLLRHPLCISALNDFTSGGFNEVIDDHDDFKNADRIILCSGKVYYDLIEYRKAKYIKHTAIIRLEQLYPFPQKQLDKILNEYQSNTKKIWLQEEPANMGAWSYIFRKLSSLNIKLISRPESASPATGSHKHHEKQQAELIAKAFD